MRYCKKCTMPDTRPGITFDAEGVCSACRHYEARKNVDWDARFKEFEAYCDKYRGMNGPGGYDCAVAVSGGKDSHFQVWMLKEVMHMNPILFSVEDNFPMTQAGIHNLKNISEEFGCTIISCKPNIKVQKTLMRKFFEKYGKPTWYVDRLIYTFPLHMAAKFNTPMLCYGENVSFEYGGNVDKETYSAMDQIENGVAVVYAATSDIGQGCNTVFLQDVAEACGLPLRCIANGECSTENAPDSGTTSGSRQTVVTGEAVRGAAFLLRDAMVGIEAGKPAPDAPVSAHGDGVKIEYDDGRAYQLRTQELVAGQGMHPQDPAAAIKALEGCEFGYVYLEPTDKLGADVPNPKSHICYGFATHVVILDDDGRVSEIYAAHDSGKVVNPISIQGQIEGGVLMGMGYALTEDWPLKDCVPQARYGTLGLFRAPEIPDIHAIYVEKDELLPVAYGGKGIGEIATIPTAPAVQNAYRAFDGKLRPDLPMVDTPYSRARRRG